MKLLHRYFLWFLLILGLISCNKQLPENLSILPSDINATEDTKDLFSILKLRAEKGIMLGHDDDLAYGIKWCDKPNQSDVKSVCGDYPAAFGWNVDNIELGASFNNDSISFSKLNSYIVQANKLGGVSTLTWFAHNPETGGECTDTSSNFVARSLLIDKSIQSNYFSYLDNLADFFNAIKDENEKLIPVIFQPFQDHNSDGKYWWSRDKCSAEEYKQLWKMTVDYLRDKKNIHNVLYSYSIQADSGLHVLEEYYPGNGYVDILGVGLNLYQKNDPVGKYYIQTLNRNLAIAVKFGEENNKVVALTKTGQEGIKIPDYFSNYLFPIISQYNLSYIMFGKNSCKDEEKYFIPIPGHPASDDFKTFANNPQILTCSELN